MMSSLDDLLSQEECEKILNRSVATPTHFLSYQIKNFHENVAGFFSENLLLTIKFLANKTPSENTYFVKLLPKANQDQLDYTVEGGIFQKEVLLYRNLLPDLLDVSRFGPRCYFIRDDCIVLENLSQKGFTMLPRMDYFNGNQCDAMLKTLAKLHASSIIFEHKRGVRIDVQFPDEVQETCYSFTEGQPRQLWCVSTTKCVMDLMQFVTIQDAEIVGNKFKKFVFEELPSFIKPSKRFRNVLNHDDLWCNNMMFRNDNECLFVDFQMVRYGPPVLDFLLSLYHTLEWNFVVNNFNALIDGYYNYLTEQLKPHRLDKELTKTEFLESVDVYKLTALTEAVMYGTHVYISEELGNRIINDFECFKDFSFVNRSKFAIQEFKDNPQYRVRLGNLIKALAKALMEQ